VPAILEKTHVYVCPSKFETQSVATIEALAAGKPIVGLSNETTDELVDENVGFLFPKTTRPEEFAKKIEDICSLDQKNYEILCQNARMRVANFDWKTVVNLTARMYSHYLERQPRKNSLAERARKIISYIPESNIKSTLLMMIEDGKNRKKTPKKKIPATAIALLGVTAGLSMLIFGGWKVAQAIKERNKAQK
jgi:hypothetical protein